MEGVSGKPLALWGGAVATLICCFAPVLGALFALVGLGGLIGYLDFALMMLAGFFVTALARVYAWRGEGRAAMAVGIATLVALASFFGRFNLVFPLLIGAGALIALLGYRRNPEVHDE